MLSQDKTKKNKNTFSHTVTGKNRAIITTDGLKIIEPNMQDKTMLRKYNSIWQVMGAKNDLESRYKLMEALVDGLIKESLTTHETAVMERVKSRWNKIHMLDHYDKSNDSFWEKEYGNCHTRSMNIEEYEKFNDFLSSLQDNQHVII